MVDLHAAFATAKTWNLISENPLAGVQKFNVSKAPKIEILTPEQLSAFLNVVDTKFIPFFTINAFTGLRRAEVERLDWSEIKLDRRLIDLPPEKSKNKRRKLVEIPEGDGRGGGRKRDRSDREKKSERRRNGNGHRWWKLPVRRRQRFFGSRQEGLNGESLWRNEERRKKRPTGQLNF